MGNEARPTATVSNTNRYRVVVLNLPHDKVCSEEADVCHCAQEVHGALRYDKDSGAAVVVGGRKRMSKAVTLQPCGHPGSVVDFLPPSVERCPDFVANRRDLTVKQLSAEDTEKLRAQREQERARAEAIAKSNAEAAERRAHRQAHPEETAEAVAAAAPQTRRGRASGAQT